MIVCAGSIGFDTVSTPFGKAERVLGGSASYFSAAARFYSPVGVVSVVGGDFSAENWKALELEGVDLSGVQKAGGEKTFFFDSSFSYDLNTRTANSTQLNVLKNFVPVIPPAMASKAEYAYLATLEPDKQLACLDQLAESKVKLRVMDTIEYYLQNDLKGVGQVISKCDGVVINDSEARLFAGTHSLLSAGKKIVEKGPLFAVIKKGEHGSLLFYAGRVYPMPALPLEEVRDPTGAGDAFAGGLLGWLAKNKASRKNLNARLLRNAVAHGTVMSSFAVEEFSTTGLARTDWQAVLARLDEYKALLNF